jgi:outer membrane immunogenic protein
VCSPGDTSNRKGVVDFLRSTCRGHHSMKKLPLAIAILAMSASSAFSADLAARPYTKAPPMIAAMYDWSGFYIGINGGGGSAHTCWDLVGFGAEGCHNSTGGTVGGQVGYRWQTGPWVFGLEAQGNWADLSGSTANLVIPGNVVRSKMDAFGLFTGQVGYAWNNVLLYAKGGAAVTDRNYENWGPAGTLLSSTGYDTRWSPTVGAGLEYGFAPNWSVGVEYNHIFEGRHSTSFTTPAGVAIPGYNSGGDTDMVLGRLNYRFGGPIIAKY